MKYCNFSPKTNVEMSEDLQRNFVAAVKKRDTETAKKLMSVSGLSDPNTWFSLFRLLCDILPTRDDVLQLLLSQADDKVLTKIFRAAVDADEYRVVDLIMKKRPSINMNMSDENGNTALHIAVHRECLEVAITLCYMVADINAKNQEGSSALHSAAVNSDGQVIAFHLMDAGADCDMRDKLGRTALHIAVIHNNEQVIEQLLAFDADVNVTCNDNLTPLEYGPHLDILKKHIIAMKALNLYVSKKNLNHVDLNGRDRALFEYYLNEIAHLKTETIDNSAVSYYDFLTCGINRLMVYAANENLIKAAELRSWNHPWYGGFIYKRVKLAKKQRRLLRQSLKSLEIVACTFFGQAFPDIDIAYGITDYLNNEDLENLIKAVPAGDDCDSWNRH